MKEHYATMQSEWTADFGSSAAAKILKALYVLLRAHTY